MVHPIERFRSVWIDFRVLSDIEKTTVIAITYSDDTTVDLSDKHHGIMYERSMSRIVKY